MNAFQLSSTLKRLRENEELKDHLSDELKRQVDQVSAQDTPKDEELINLALKFSEELKEKVFRQIDAEHERLFNTVRDGIKELATEVSAHKSEVQALDTDSQSVTTQIDQLEARMRELDEELEQL